MQNTSNPANDNEKNKDVFYNELFGFFQEVTEFTSSVNSELNDVKVVCHQVQKQLEQTTETPDEDTLNLGSTHAKLLVDIKKATDGVIPMLAGISDQRFFQKDINVQPLEDYLEKLEYTKTDNMELRKLFTAFSTGIKQISCNTDSSQADNTPEDIDSLFAFSDFIEENPKVATSSPFPDHNNMI